MVGSELVQVAGATGEPLFINTFQLGKKAIAQLAIPTDYQFAIKPPEHNGKANILQMSMDGNFDW